MTTSVHEDRQRFILLLAESLRLSPEATPIFVGLTLSKPTATASPDREAKRIDFRLISLKGDEMISANFRYEHRDETKNFPLPEAVSLIETALDGQFLCADLHCQGIDHSLRIDRKAVAHLISRKSSMLSAPIQMAHNRSKQRHVLPTAPWLQLLGVSDHSGAVIPRMQDKFRQIDKFVEIIDDLIEPDGDTNQALSVVDMGCGKAYLTFALYDHLCGRFQLSICGIEQRSELVASGNNSAVSAGFAPLADGRGLNFVQGSIADWASKAGPEFSHPDILVALHACDTATDDALIAGIRAGTNVIICSPCCHKQLRSDMKAEGIISRITRFGILEERLAEILTDSIRALVLEAYGYKTKVFEFISAEHTGKNLMISAVRNRGGIVESQRIAKLAEAQVLAETFGVRRHYLLENLS